MFTLHYSPGTISIAVAIGMQEVGAAYEAVKVDFKAGDQQSADYLAKNPKGRVPLLETPDGLMTETGALLEYVAPGLVPEGAAEQARMRELMYYLAGTMHVAHAHKMRGARWADAEASLADMKRKVPETIAASCAYLEETLALSPFAMGAALTCADPYLFMLLHWVPGDGVALENYPKLAEFYAMMQDRESIKAVTKKGML